MDLVNLSTGCGIKNVSKTGPLLEHIGEAAIVTILH